MWQKNYRLTDEAALCALPEQLAAAEWYRQAKSSLVQIYTVGVELDKAKAFIQKVQRALPRAVVIAVSSTIAVELLQTDREKKMGQEQKIVGYWKIEINCCGFAKSQAACSYISVEAANDKTAREELALRLAAQPDLRAGLVFFAGIDVKADDFLRQVSQEIPEVPLVGMAAGFTVLNHANESFKGYFQYNMRASAAADQDSSQYLSVQGQVYSHGVLFVTLSGSGMTAKAQYLLGWHPVGKYLQVSGVQQGKIVHKLDGISAAAAYSKYLGVPFDQFFIINIVDFPLLLEREGAVIGRIPLAVGEESIYFPGDVAEGEKMRFGYANQQEVLTETWRASEEIARLQPEAIFLFVCGSRTLFLQEDAQAEIEYYRRLCPELLSNHGNGEVYRYHGQGGILTGAFVALSLWESPVCDGCTVPLPPVEVPKPLPQEIPLATRLAYFIKATTTDMAEYADQAEAAREKAETANEAKSSFLSNMSHEIRTPINAIIGLNEMILRECDDPNILSYAEDVKGAAGHLLGLVNDILDFSKIEAGKLEVIPVEYSPGSMMNDILNMITVKAEAKGLELRMEVDADIPCLLRGDEVRLKQICMNVLTNAVKYTEHGSVTLRAAFRKLNQEQMSLTVQVRDTGIGIKAEDMPRLFSAFERIEEMRNRTIEGTGLGMNITQRLLEMMGSRLEVESVYGRGSTFSFTVTQEVLDWKPVGELKMNLRRGRAANALDVRAGGKFTAPAARILVVDDTEMNLKVIKGLLKRTLIQVDVVLSGPECLQLVKKVHYDMIFLDHRMPGMDGIETLQRLNVMEHQSKDAAIVALTANAVSGAREQYLAAGFNEYLTKPIDAEKLEMMLLEYLPASKVTLLKDNVAEAADASAKAAGLPEWLLADQELDWEAGLYNCGSSEAYQAALQLFHDTLPETLSVIRGFYEAADWENYTIKVHALKSSARIIGARLLSKMAERLEAAGDAGRLEEIHCDTGALLARGEALGISLAPLAAWEDEAAEKETMTTDEVREVYEALREFAAGFDYDDAVFVLDSMAGRQPPAREKEHWAAVVKAVRKPDWETLKELLSGS